MQRGEIYISQANYKVRRKTYFAKECVQQTKLVPEIFFPVTIFILLLQKIALKLIAFESEVSLECRSKDCRGGGDRERERETEQSHKVSSTQNKLYFSSSIGS